MEETLETKDLVLKLAQFLNDAKVRDVVALDVRQGCVWTDFFVIGTFNSQGHLKGLVNELEKFAQENQAGSLRLRKSQPNEWILIDWDDVVIHLFSEKARGFYELEKLWFSAEKMYQSS